MGILERLGNVVKSYLNDEIDAAFRKRGRFSAGTAARGRGDPDLDAAFEELDGFLGGKEAPPRQAQPERPARRQVPAEILADFEELGLAPQAGAAECKAAYKKLLKEHHPDRHAGKSDEIKRATEKTARVNAAYRRIENWLKS